MNTYYKDIKAKAMTQVTHWYDGVIIAWHWNISFIGTFDHTHNRCRVW